MVPNLSPVDIFPSRVDGVVKSEQKIRNMKSDFVIVAQLIGFPKQSVDQSEDTF